MRIPDAYLELRLREVLALAAPAPSASPRAGAGDEPDAVDVEVIVAAVRDLAARIEREGLDDEGEQRNWLAQCFERWNTSPPLEDDNA